MKLWEQYILLINGIPDMLALDYRGLRLMSGVETGLFVTFTSSSKVFMQGEERVDKANSMNLNGVGCLL